MTSTNIVKVALVQSKASSDPAKNLENSLQKASEAASKGAQIICLQELYKSLYFPQKEDYAAFDLAETIPGPSTEAFCKFAKEKKVVIILPIFEKRAKGLYHNSAVVINADGKILGTYRKMHIPDDPGFFEKFYFTPGDLGFKTFKTKYAKIGVLICWDQWYPEGARLTALQGADILFYPTAIGWHKNELQNVREIQLSAWKTIQRSHAIANGVFVAAPNRVGTEGELTFWGNSFITSPTGEVLAQAGEDKEEVLIADCNLNDIEVQRQSWPFLRDRRIDYYKALLKRFDNE